MKSVANAVAKLVMEVLNAFANDVSPVMSATTSLPDSVDSSSSGALAKFLNLASASLVKVPIAGAVVFIRVPETSLSRSFNEEVSD